MKALKNTALALIILGISMIILGYSYYTNRLAPVSEATDLKLVEIKKGNSAYDIGKLLEEEGLIKSEKIFRIFLKLEGDPILQAGFYNLSPSMGVKNIVKEIESGNAIDLNAFNITIKEGININDLATLIEENTNNTEEQVYAALKDTQYLEEIINEYWFISSEIKDTDIYYSLEGYLSPNTYTLKNKDVTVKEIFKKMLDEQSKVLTESKDEIEKSEYSVHELLTLASIVEKEGVHDEDRRQIAGVFFNRLEENWSLGSDVTTYYGAKVNMSDRDLYKSEIEENNAYNTREPYLQGELPIGPICLSSKESIDAVINPTNNEYMFFVADKNRKVYFGETYSDHQDWIQTIKENGDWIEW